MWSMGVKDAVLHLLPNSTMLVWRGQSQTYSQSVLWPFQSTAIAKEFSTKCYMFEIQKEMHIVRYVATWSSLDRTCLTGNLMSMGSLSSVYSDFFPSEVAASAAAKNP